MHYSLASIATILLASTALAIPLELEKRDRGVYTKVVTKTITEIVYGTPKPTSTPCTGKPKATHSPPSISKPVYKPPVSSPVKKVPVSSPVYKPPPQPKYSSTSKPKPKPTPTPPQSGLNDFARSALDTHNRYRALHSAPALQWDDEMANYAAEWTSHCVFKHTGSSYGENIAAGYSSIEAAITAWYDEGKDYDYGHPGFSEECGHFTQVVWIHATKVGCGSYVCNGANGTPGTYYSCNYDTGNVDGEFGDNVK